MPKARASRQGCRAPAGQQVQRSLQETAPGRALCPAAWAPARNIPTHTFHPLLPRLCAGPALGAPGRLAPGWAGPREARWDDRGCGAPRSPHAGWLNPISSLMGVPPLSPSRRVSAFPGSGISSLPPTPAPAWPSHLVSPHTPKGPRPRERVTTTPRPSVHQERSASCPGRGLAACLHGGARPAGWSLFSAPTNLQSCIF